MSESLLSSILVAARPIIFCSFLEFEIVTLLSACFFLLC